MSTELLAIQTYAAAVAGATLTSAPFTLTAAGTTITLKTTGGGPIPDGARLRIEQQQSNGVDYTPIDMLHPFRVRRVLDAAAGTYRVVHLPPATPGVDPAFGADWA